MVLQDERGKLSERVNNLCDYSRPGNQMAGGRLCSTMEVVVVVVVAALGRWDEGESSEDVRGEGIRGSGG